MNGAIDWEEGGDILVYEAEELIHMGELYNINCPECDERVYCTEFDPDADGPCWLHECDNCDLYIQVVPKKLHATATRK